MHPWCSEERADGHKPLLHEQLCQVPQSHLAMKGTPVRPPLCWSADARPGGAVLVRGAAWPPSRVPGKSAEPAKRRGWLPRRLEQPGQLLCYRGSQSSFQLAAGTLHSASASSKAIQRRRRGGEASAPEQRGDRPINHPASHCSSFRSSLGTVSPGEPGGYLLASASMAEPAKTARCTPRAGPFALRLLLGCGMAALNHCSPGIREQYPHWSCKGMHGGFACGRGSGS